MLQLPQQQWQQPFLTSSFSNCLLYKKSQLHTDKNNGAATYRSDRVGGACGRREQRHELMSLCHRASAPNRRRQRGGTATDQHRCGGGPDARFATPDWMPGLTCWWAEGDQGRADNYAAVWQLPHTPPGGKTTAVSLQLDNDLNYINFLTVHVIQL